MAKLNMKTTNKSAEIDGIVQRTNELKSEFEELIAKRETSGKLDVARVEEIAREIEKNLALVLEMREELLKIH